MQIMAFMVAQPVTFAFWSWALHVRQDGVVFSWKRGDSCGSVGNTRGLPVVMGSDDRI